MHQIKVNDKYRFEIDIDKDAIKVNRNEIKLDVISLKENVSSILFKNKSYNIELVLVNKQEKTATIKVNGNIYDLSIKDQYDRLLKQLGMDNLVSSKILQIKAPMPGLVLSVLVGEGTEIKKGDNLLILEAMKMENMIKSPTDGIVKKITIVKGDKVEKNELLISFV